MTSSTSPLEQAFNPKRLGELIAPVTCVFLCVAVLTCCSRRQDISTALNAADAFHSQLARGQYEQIFSEATPEFQNSISRDGSRTLFARIIKGLGNPESSSFTRVQVNHMPAGSFIVAQSRTKFEKGEAIENFTWRVNEGKPFLVAYTVSSPLLTRNP